MSGVNDKHGGLTNDLASWWPEAARSGVKVPKSLIIPVADRMFASMLDGEHLDDAGWNTVEQVASAIGYVGGPVFLRTGEMSGKHQWADTCHVTDIKRVPAHIYSLFENQGMAFGVPAPEHLVVRELLKTVPVFTAFNRMPITKERRYFAKSGHVYDHHPYWPAGAIEGHSPTLGGRELEAAEWLPLLRSISVETEDEVSELTTLTERVAEWLPSDWSIDWLWTADRGWVFIDAAHAEQSYRMADEDRAEFRQ